MSKLEEQVEILRDRAHGLCMLADGLSAPYIIPSTKETMFLTMKSAAGEMRDAADTIESLRDGPQEMQGETCSLYTSGKESNYKRLFGTPERAARTMMGISERMNFDGIGGDYDTLLGWLRGDA